MDVTDDWVATIRRLGGRPDPAVGAALLARYAEPHRHYHSVEHLRAVLSAVDALAPHADQPAVVRLAAWYHDAVYDPRRSDNEERSARLAESELVRAGLAQVAAGRVAELVRVTVDHDPPVGDADAQVLCDADLAVLSSSAADYERYVAAVRREYAHVDERGWRAGRAAVLRRLLERPALFRTDTARAWEPAARRNVGQELAALTDPSAGAAPQR